MILSSAYFTEESILYALLLESETLIFLDRSLEGESLQGFLMAQNSKLDNGHYRLLKRLVLYKF